MKRIFFILMCMVFLAGCGGLQFKKEPLILPQQKEETKRYGLPVKDYTSIFKKSGLDIDTNLNDAVDVPYGGTDANTLTDGGVLLGSGTGAVTAMSVLADSEMIVGDGTTDPVAESGATLRTSIGVGTGDSPQFTGIELSHATENTLTASSGVLSIEGVQIYMVGDEDTIGAAMTATGADAVADTMTATGADAIAADVTTPGSAFDTLADFTDDIDATLRFCQGQTFQTFGAADTTPDVSNGGSTVVQCWRTAGTPTITAFDDGDDTSEFADGDTVFVLFNSAAVFTINESASFKGHGNNDYPGAAGEGGWFTWDDTNNYWVVKFSETKSANFTTLRVPNDESADAALANLGEVHMRGDEDTLNLHAGAGGEVAGEVSISMLQHVAIPIDFTYVYDRDTAHRLPLFVVNSKLYPNGITIDYISVKHIGNRTTALDADLKRATDFQGTSTALILALDVGAAADEMAQDTDASINSGAVVAAGQHIYIEVSADPVDEDNLATVEIIFHAEAD